MATVLSVLPLTTRGPVLSMPVTMAECALHSSKGMQTAVSNGL